MGLKLDEASELPTLAPIRTTGIDARPPEEDQLMSGFSSSGEAAEYCVTPKSEEHVLKPALVCPPAPRKPRPAKRKVGPPPRGYYPVPAGDLVSVFVPLSCPVATKKIRVG